MWIMDEGNHADASPEDIFVDEERWDLLGNYDAVSYCKRCPEWCDFLDLVQTTGAD